MLRYCAVPSSATPCVQPPDTHCNTDARPAKPAVALQVAARAHGRQHLPVRALGLAAAAALVLHAALLGAWPGKALQTAPSAAPGPAPPPLVVRQLARTGALTANPAALQPTEPQPPARAQPGTRRAGARLETNASTGADTLSSPALNSPVEGQPGVAPPVPQDTTAPTAASATPDTTTPPDAAAAPTLPIPATVQATAAAMAPAAPTTTAAEGAGADGAAPPTYRTQPAPAATLLFDLTRGLAGGQAVLTWRPDGPGGSYTLQLQAQAFGIAVAGWASAGRFDGAGLAPERYAESRRGRVVRATNFQRADDKISFSAQAQEYPLAAGTQDRSSWMLQLGAILQANPELAQPGAQVTMVVVGTRGAPEPWVFKVVDRTALALASGDSPSSVADAVHLVREPRRPYDTKASVWLDPARHHLPLKVQLLVHTTGEGQTFELRQLTLP